jgi:hypothetical protein
MSNRMRRARKGEEVVPRKRDCDRPPYPIRFIKAAARALLYLRCRRPERQDRQRRQTAVQATGLNASASSTAVI